MSRSTIRLVGAFLLGGLAGLPGSGAAVAQEVVLPPPSAGIVVEVAPNVDGDVLAVAPPVQFSLTADAGSGEAVFFAHPVGDDPASLLEMGNVQKELDLIDEQKEKIRGAQRKMQEAMQQHFTEMRELHTRRIRDLQDSQGGVARGEAGGGPGRARPRVAGPGAGEPGAVQPGAVQPGIVAPPEEFKKSQERIKELRDQLAKEVDQVLLPHQKKRLEEIRLRMKMKMRGTSGSLVDTELAKTLDINDAQKERIRRRAAEVQQNLEEKIAKLREEAREEILSELTPEQQGKLKDLLGMEFDDRPQPLAPPRIRRPRPPAVDRKFEERKYEERRTEGRKTEERKPEEKVEEKPAAAPAERGS